MPAVRPLTFYRGAIWLPIALPVAVALLLHGLGITIGTGALRKIAQVLLMSLLYGGIPYAAIALWATWWIGGRSEPQIKRLVVRAPLLMAAVFAPLALVAGVAVGAPEPFAAVAVLGAIFSIVLGYAYVALVFLLRSEFGLDTLDGQELTRD